MSKEVTSKESEKEWMKERSLRLLERMYHDAKDIANKGGDDCYEGEKAYALNLAITALKQQPQQGCNTVEKQWFTTNINGKMKVRLTDLGEKILQDNREELNWEIQKRGGEGLGELEVKVDELGFTEFQLWDMMGTFGTHMKLGVALPIEIDILLQGRGLREES